MNMTPREQKAARQFFQQSAETYEQYAVLQREIGSRLLERTEFRRYEPAVVLDLGCATGSTSLALAGQFPDARVIGFDWSLNMLARTKGVHALCADMHRLPFATASVDLVFSNLAISWGWDVPAIFAELRRVMRAGAMLVFTCFGPDTLFELNSAWRQLNQDPTAQQFPDMHDVGDEMVRAGFREPVMDAGHLALEYPDLPSLLRELQATGIGMIAGQGLRDVIGGTGFDQFAGAYESYRREGRCPVTFEIIYGTAFAPEAGQPVKTPAGDVATFSVDALRVKSRKKD